MGTLWGEPQAKMTGQGRRPRKGTLPTDEWTATRGWTVATDRRESGLWLRTDVSLEGGSTWGHELERGFLADASLEGDVCKDRRESGVRQSQAA